MLDSPWAVLVFLVLMCVFMLVAFAIVFGRLLFAKDTKLPDAVARLHQQGYQVIPEIRRAPTFPFSEFTNNPYGRTRVHITVPGTFDTAFHFSYVYETNTGTATERLGCAVVPVPFVAPAITIRKGSRSVASFFQGNRVNTDSAPFNSAYAVECKDERFAYTLLGYELIDWLLSEPAFSSDLTVKMKDNWMLLYSPNVTYEALPGILTMAQTARGRLPAVLTSMYPLPQQPFG